MKNKSFISLLLITVLGVMLVPLYNGFGLTEGDTRAYIESGIHNTIPMDRSPFYGWFVRYTSMVISLWFTLIAQSLLLSWLLLRYIARIQLLYAAHRDGETPGSTFRLSLFTVISIVSFTCISWVAGYLMPDVFAGILLLAVLLYLAGSKGYVSAIYLLIIFTSIIIHNSHMPITGLFAAVLVVWALVKKNRAILKRSLAILSLCFLSWLLISSINAANGSGFTYSRGGHVFMVTKFAETGILKLYLDDNCGKKNLKLCNYRDSIPVYSWIFLWDEHSPLYKTGGWDSNKAEFRMIIHDVFTTPKYLRLFAANSATSTLRQLTQVHAPDMTTFQGAGAAPWDGIRTYFPDELNEYAAAKQNTTGLSGTYCNYIYYLFFICSTIWALLYCRSFSKELVFIYGSILLFLIINAFVTSTFSTVINRFQNRVFWVFPATNAILIIRHYWCRFQTYDVNYNKKSKE